MPCAEKRLFFLAGYLVNEFSVLIKFRGWSVAASSCDDVREHEARTSQVVFLSRLIIGKLYEARNTLCMAYCKANLDNDFKRRINKEALAGLEQFMSMTEGNDNLLRRIRNKLSFHTDKKKVIDDAIQAIPSDADLRIYSTVDGQSYLQFADIGIHIILAKLAGEEGLKGITNAMEAGVSTTQHLMTFLNGCLDAFFATYPLVETRESVTLSDLEALEEVSIPYFTRRGGKNDDPMPLTIRFPLSISGVS